MPHPRLVGRFVVALYERVGGAANPWRRADDVARYDGLPMGKLGEVLVAATSAGLVDRNANDPDLVTLTAAGLSAARGKTAR
ncbi:hypothetical protein RSO01_62270 [Reyranella soli]|jgi:hypothetical protein|uniref:Uncharacterized protein n=1 Tax=Reyranella soli TaxID=1230389 RepID=A0A512NJD5_9HYPH|nr:hypothetical protein RSO01_62270 [Reyranella soli]